MSNIHNFPELNLSPSKLRLNYTLNSKSTKSTKSKKFSIQNLETPPESLTRRISLSPKKPERGSSSSILTRLQDQLDLEEIRLKTSELKSLPDKKRKKAEQKVYSRFMVGLIQRVIKTNESLGKLLERGWKGYQEALMPLKSADNSTLVNKVNAACIDHCTQVSQEMIILKNEEDIEVYIESLHRAIKGINSMNIDKIIGKLNELTYTLRPVDIPSASETPDVEELDFTESLKSIHSRLRARSMRKAEKVMIPEKTQGKNQVTQTLLRMEDLKTMDAYRSVIKSKEELISELNLKLKRKNDSEEELSSKNKEIDELKRDFFRLKQECLNCSIKDKKLMKTESELQKLRVSVTGEIAINGELNEAKKKLEEYLEIINSKQSAINQLNKNVQELEKKCEEAQVQKESLQNQLKVEETLRRSIESELQAQIDSNSTLKLSLNPNNFPNSPSSSIQKNRTHTSFKKSSSASPEKKRTIIRTELKDSEIKKSKKETLMSILGITKEEYLSFSKKTRLDIYICLLKHNKRCGIDCEHLRRAMMIRFKNKGPLFPLKKYNIE